MKFYQVDAFTEVPYEGNPCAVFPDAAGLSDSQMLAIAREMHLSETAFLSPSQRADVRARYFMPTGEIPLAGHPTIASLFVMLREGMVDFAEAGVKSVTMELTAGVITVTLRGTPRRPWITMRQLRPAFGRRYSAEIVAEAFGLRPADMLPGYPPQTVSTGTPQLMVPLREETALNRARLNEAAYLELHRGGDFFSPHLFVLYGAPPNQSTRARHFGGVSVSDEDPFTGSATGGMAAYLYHHGLLGSVEFTALQGATIHRPGIAHCRVVPDSGEGIAAVEITGTAVETVRGELTTLPE